MSLTAGWSLTGWLLSQTRDLSNYLSVPGKTDLGSLLRRRMVPDFCVIQLGSNFG
jgi:hypothetical protein